MDSIKFTHQQSAVIEDRGGSLLVSAAAGTGKTRVLVERIMKKVMDENKEISDFLIITYTTAAAAELRSRIVEDLAEKSAKMPKNKHLRRQIAMAGSASIGTIHSFCGKLVREYAHELDISPDFRNIDETEIGIIKDEVLTDLIDERYKTEIPGFIELVDTLSSGRRDDALVQTVLTAHNSIQSHPYPRKWIEGEINRLENIKDISDPLETAWGKYLMDEASKMVKYWTNEFIDGLDDIDSDENLHRAYWDSWNGTLADLKKLGRALGTSWAEANKNREISFPKIKPTPKGFEYLRDKRKRCMKEMEKVGKTFSLSPDLVIEDMYKSRVIISAFLKLVLDFEEEYSKEKRRRNVLDFNDLEHLALNVLIDEESGNSTEAAEDIGKMYAEVLVDEFQDVNAVQNMIFTSITDRNLFVVGDVKQSIYRFRLADPSIFIDYYNSFPDYQDAVEGEPRKVLLSQNFRSHKDILEGVNFVFRNVMVKEFGGLEYKEREYLVPGKESENTGAPVVELDVIDQLGFEESAGVQARDIEPRFVALRVKELIEKGGYKPGDIVILLRSVTGKAWRYERELKRLNIQASSAGGDFYHTKEIMSLTSVLDIIDNPTRDVSLISAMSSPLFGFTGDELALIRSFARYGCFYNAVVSASEENEKCAHFLSVLNKLRLLAPDESVQNLLWQVLEQTDALSIFGAMENGEIRRENIMRMLEYAGSFERGGHKGLFVFLGMFRDAGEKGKLTGADASAKSSKVTIMTIHSSKGLEFPVVIMADMCKDFNREDTKGAVLIHPELGVGIKLRDMERKISYSTMARDAISNKIKSENAQEELRVLYVAMTRPVEKLIMTCTYKNAEKTLSDIAGKASDPLSPYVIESVKNMAEWVLLPLMLCKEKEKLGIEGISPQGECMWDVNMYRHSEFMDEVSGLKFPEEIPEITEKANTAEPKQLAETIRQRIYGTYKGEEYVNLPSKLTATELKGWKSETANEEALPMKKRKIVVKRPKFITEEKKLTGAERGTAAHLIMQYADYSKCLSIEGIRDEIARLETIKLITPEQAAAVDPELIMRFFDSDLGRAVVTSKSLSREFKFSLLVPANTYYDVGHDGEILLQGVIDCFFETEEGITVVDFKTDYVSPATINDVADSYATQLEVYAYALNRIFGKQVSSKYLFFFSAGEAVEVR